jgi:hypothetical protein
MSNKLASLLTVIFIFATAFVAGLLSSGCGGAVPGPDDDTSGFSAVGGGTGYKPIVFPAPALVEWQFDACLTPNQRNGLIAALQQVHASELAELTPSVGLSVCSSVDGQERGGLFFTNTSAAGRNLTVSSLAIRPVQRRYAFAINKTAYNAVAAHLFAGMPKRFDANGVPTTNGRYLLSGWSETHDGASANWVSTAEALHFVDTQTQMTADLDEDVPTTLDQWGALEAGGFPPAVSPSSSNDPFEQTVINAVDAIRQKTQYIFEPARYTIMALDFAAAPSLKGWLLPFDLLTVDATGGVIASGGETIM